VKSGHENVRKSMIRSGGGLNLLEKKRGLVSEGPNKKMALEYAAHQQYRVPRQHGGKRLWRPTGTGGTMSRRDGKRLLGGGGGNRRLGWGEGGAASKGSSPAAKDIETIKNYHVGKGLENNCGRVWTIRPRSLQKQKGGEERGKGVWSAQSAVVRNHSTLCQNTSPENSRHLYGQKRGQPQEESVRGGESGRKGKEECNLGGRPLEFCKRPAP